MEDFEVRAESRYVPQSARKVRLVVNRVRGMDVLEALGTLKLMPQRAATSLHKLVNSAVANAENNFGMDAEDLYIAEAWADDGPIRRWRRFGARGRFKPIQKRSAHITVILRERRPVEF
jgi:large subunit ribosomal protein L22